MFGSGLGDAKCKSQCFLLQNVLICEMMKSHSEWGLVIRLNFQHLHLSFIIHGMWTAIDAAFFFSSVGFAVCLKSILVSESASTWRLEFCTFGNMPRDTWIPSLATFFLEVCTRWSVHFHWLTFTSKFVCTFSTSVIATFSVTFRVSVQWTFRRKWTHCLPCSSHAWMRMLLTLNIGLLWSNGCSLLSRSCCFGIRFAFSFRLSFARSYFCRSVLVSISRFEMRVEMSFGHQLQSVIVTPLVAECSILSVDLQTHISTLPTFQLASCADSPKAVSKSVSNFWWNFAQLYVEARTLSFSCWTFDKSWSPRTPTLSPLILKKS